MKSALVACLLFCFAGVASGQEPVRLHTATTLRCEFPVSVIADMVGDSAVTSPGRASTSLIFDKIDLVKGTARLIGNVGAADIGVVGGENGITFLEITQSGVVQVTAVHTATTKQLQFKAVASRHTAVGGNPIPSQAYGSCRALLQ